MFIMLVGCAGSGKSTWAQTFKKDAEERGYEACIVSSDAIHKELWGDESTQREPEKVFELAHRRIIEALERNCDFVIFDATNIKARRRRVLMQKIARFDCEKRCYIFAEPYHILCLRNKKRARQVPEEVIWRMITQFEMPLFTEGYDTIELYNRNQVNLDECIEHMRDYDQENPRHTFDLLTHCREAAKIVNEDTTLPQVVGVAAFLHDVGKIFTKTFFDMKGRETEIAHYYGHGEVGGYLALLFDANWRFEERLMIAQLICYHMVPYDIKTDKARDRWKERLGALYPMIMAIHEGDKAAH